MIEKYLFILPGIWIGFFLLYTLIKTIFPSTEKYIFCTTCFAFSSTLILSFFLKFPSIIISYLLGLSLTGAAYKLDETFKDPNGEPDFPMQFFVIQLFLSTIGLIGTFALDKI